MVLEDPRSVIKWLLQPGNQRHLRVLETLSTGEFQAPVLRDELGIDHDEQVYRSLEYLQKRGLVSEFRDFSGNRQGAIYEVSPIGERILEVVHEVEELIAGHPPKTGEVVVRSARAGTVDTLINVGRDKEVRKQVGTVSEGAGDDTVTVTA